VAYLLDRLERRWNHNIHYHPVLLAAVPERCRSALDVGCGEGVLARRLRRTIPRVTAIDLDEQSIELARADTQADEIDYVLGDFIAYPFEPASFDFIVCVAALHHMEAAAALNRMCELLTPGGTLAVLGLARSRYPADLPRDIAAVAVHRAHWLARREVWRSPAPTMWPPPHTYPEIRSLAECTLPGARVRRHLLWRYSLIWTKPDD
jgi:SAM-dependent methyltransferase